MPTKSKLEFRTLRDGDFKQYREVRLEALKAHPESFIGCYDDESQAPDSFFKKTIHNHEVFGCFHQSDKLVGVIGHRAVMKKGKRAHTGQLWGFYIHPDYRGRGFAKRLLTYAVEDAAQVFEKLVLRVNARDKKTVQLYESVGFQQYGYETKSIKIGKKYYDRRLMELLF